MIWGVNSIKIVSIVWIYAVLHSSRILKQSPSCLTHSWTRARSNPSLRPAVVRPNIPCVWQFMGGGEMSTVVWMPGSSLKIVQTSNFQCNELNINSDADVLLWVVKIDAIDFELRNQVSLSPMAEPLIDIRVYIIELRWAFILLCDVVWWKNKKRKLQHNNSSYSIHSCWTNFLLSPKNFTDTRTEKKLFRPHRVESFN